MTEPSQRRDEVRIRVAGVTFRVASADPEGPALSLPPASLKFEVPASGAVDLDLRASWGDLSDAPAGAPVFDSGGTWRLYRNGPTDVFRFWARQKPAVPYQECRLHEGRSTGDLVLHRDHFDAGEAVALQYPLDEVLMIHLLAGGRGVELHACGVVTPEGRGYLFAGQSGDGKTTTARLWEELRGTVVLSDDRIVVREESGRYVMHGTPWHGEAELSASRSVPVDAVFLLEHGAENRLLPLSVPDAAARLAARSFVPFHDADALHWSLGFLEGLVRSVPCHRFAFVPDPSARELVRAGGTPGTPSLDSSTSRDKGAVSEPARDSRG